MVLDQGAIAVGYLSVDLLEASARASDSRPAARRLTAVEHNVVKVSLSDPLSSIREIGRVGSVLRLTIGVKGSNRLANDRLEAIRRFAVSRRLETGAAHARAVSSAEIAGIEAPVLAQIRNIVDAHVRRHSRTRFNAVALLPLVAASAAVYWVFGLLNKHTGDPYVTFMLMCVGSVMMVPMLLPRSSRGGQR